MNVDDPIDAIVFDLDGTLWDTCEACAIGWNEVIKRRGFSFRTVTSEDVRRVMGKPHELCVRETFAGLPDEQLAVLIADTMIEDNIAVRRHGGDVYADVVSGLRELNEHFRLFIVSNCQSGYIETFIELSRLNGVFADFECWGNTGLSKSDNLSALIRRNGLANPLMVGDMESDRAAARACGVGFIHAAYGFGQVQECDRRIRTFDELVRTLLEI